MHNIASALLDVLIFWLLTTPHEFAHAWVATRLGDDTPKLEGRVTLYPLAHVDWLGTVLLPAVTSLFGGGFLGWGRPVNTNIAKLRGHYNGLLLVALAGPASNILMAVLLAALGALVPQGQQILFRAAVLSLYLALFNLLPVPPLDGSKALLAARLPAMVYVELSRFGFILLLVVMFSTGLARWMSQVSYQSALTMFLFFKG
jgi:Zn-dependent protease